MAGDKEHPFAHRIDVAGGTTRTLREHVSDRLQPWRIPVMARHGGIRVMRGGTAIATALDDPVQSGDVIVIDDTAGKTWSELMKTATADYRDLLLSSARFEASTGAGELPFLLKQCAAVVVDERAVDLGQQVPTLTDLVKRLVPLGTHPIRHLILVAHASPYGDIGLRVRESRDSDKAEALDPAMMSWESMNEAIDEGTLFIVPPVRATPPPLPKLLPRPTDEQGKFTRCAVIIRGCSSGIHQIFLDKIRYAFGYMVDSVVMPKYFEAVDEIITRPAVQPPALVEFMMHDYTVYSKTALTRTALLTALRARKFKNWLDVAVPDTAWDALLPPAIHQGLSSTPVAPVEVQVPGRRATATIRTYLDTFPLQIGAIDISRAKTPTDEEVREAVIAGLDRTPQLKDTIWPFWMRMKLPSRAAFDDMWTYNKQAKSPGTWTVWASAHQYTVRTPLLLEDDRTLFCNHHPRGDEGTATRALRYYDDRIFGISSARLPAHWAPDVEPRPAGA